MSSHADTIRYAFFNTKPSDVAAARHALDALLAENQRLREALGVARPYVYNAMYDRQVNKGWRYQTAVESLRTVDEALAGDAE